MTEQIARAETLPAGDPQRIYWYQLDLVLTQLNGMYRSYLHARNGQWRRCVIIASP